MSVFAISGYWVEDKSPIQEVLVTDYHDIPPGYGDDEIFHFGLSEVAIEHVIATKEPVDNEFVITDFWSYE